jgi:FkbH-like protein
MKFWTNTNPSKQAESDGAQKEAEKAPEQAASESSAKGAIDWAATDAKLPAEFLEAVAQASADAGVTPVAKLDSASAKGSSEQLPAQDPLPSQAFDAGRTPSPEVGGSNSTHTNVATAAPVDDSTVASATVAKSADSTAQPAPESRKLDVYAERLKYLKETLAVFHNGAATLSPQELTVPDHFPAKALIVGHCSAENWAFHQNNVTKTPCEFLLVNNLQTLPTRSNEDLAEFDFQVINFPMRFVLQDSFLWGANAKTEKEMQAVFDQSVQSLRRLFNLYTEYNAQNGLLTFVTNFMVPSFNPNGKLAPYYTLCNPQYFIERLNQEIETMALGRTNMFMINLDAITAYFGKRYVQEDLLHLISHGSYMPGNRKDEERIEHAPPLGDHYRLAYVEFLGVLWVEILSAYRIANPKQQIKLIVVDLDDTLWQGAVGDMSSLDIGVTEGWPVGVLEALSYFKDRGGLVAILSKNYPETVQKAWKQFYENRFPIDNFISVKAAFTPKYLQMKEILADANLTPESVLFIDDNPVERAEMKAAYPKMRVLHGFHYYWRKVILLSAETQVASFTQESLDRTALIKKQMELKKQLEESDSRESFLAALEIAVDIKTLSAADDQAFERCFELLNKTNQFNTTGKRWDRTDFLEAASAGEVLYFSVEDRYSSHGIVGVLMTKGSSIEQFVMSCRVVGLNVEFGVLDQVLNMLIAKYPQQVIQAKLISTDLNLLSRNLYADFGFVNQAGRLVYDPKMQAKPRYQGAFSFV